MDLGAGVDKGKNELVSDTNYDTNSKMENAGLCMVGQAGAGQVRVDTVAILAQGTHCVLDKHAVKNLNLTNYSAGKTRRNGG